ncbi:mechanosensitive ion channel family protein [Thermoproteota archaeon]
MQNFITFIHTTFGLHPDIQIKLLTSLAIILFLWLVRTFTIFIVWRQTDKIKTRYMWRKATSYILFIFIVLLIGRVWFHGFQGITTFLGLVSAGIAIALKDPLTNIAAWFFIVIKNPFNTGDRIQIGDHAGDVIDRRLMQFSLLEIGNWVNSDQSTGRILHIPNAKVFLETLANYGQGFAYIWDEISILITFESDWKKAKKLLLDIVNEHAEALSSSAEKRVKAASRKFMIYYSKLTPTVYTSVRNSGVLLTLRYLCEPRSRRGRQEIIWEQILNTFKKHKDIDFAYPTQRFYNNLHEGKQAVD